MKHDETIRRVKNLHKSYNDLTAEQGTIIQTIHKIKEQIDFMK